MKARIVEPQVKVFSEPDVNSLSISSLSAGDEVDYSGMRWKAWKSWAMVTLANGQKGYLPAETKIFFIKQAVLLQNDIQVYSEPTKLSLIKQTLQKKNRFYITKIIDKDTKSWVKIRDLSGNEGYIDGHTRIRVMTEVTRATGSRNMLSGGMWCLAGIVVSGFPFSAPSAGGVLIVTWGALLYGSVKFLLGLYQYWTSPS
jgi:hypothetical protein